MKIAIVFFGIPRAANVTYPSIKEKILDVIGDNFEMRCFYHFYKLNKVVNLRSGENGVIANEMYDFFSNYEGILEQPGECLEKLNFEKIKSFGDYWRDGFVSLNNLVHQLNSLNSVTELAKPWKPDAVLFLRPDLLYHDFFDINYVSRVLTSPRKIYIPDWQWWRGYNDRFALCGKTIYEIYGGRASQIENFCITNQKALHSESLVRFSLQQSYAKVRVLKKARASRVRIDGKIKEEDFSGISCMGKTRLAEVLFKKTFYV